MKPLKTMLSHVRHAEDEDDVRQRPLDFGLIRRIFGFTRAYRKMRDGLFVLVTIRSIQLPLVAWALGAVIGGPVSHLDPSGVVWGALGYLALAALTHFTLYYRVRTAQEMGEYVIRDVRQQMFEQLQRLTMSFFHRTSSGRIISRFTNDAESVRAGVQDVFYVAIVGLGQMIIASVFMLYYDWVLFLVVAGMGPVLYLMNVAVHRKLSRIYRTVQESFSRVTATLAESVTGIRVTQGFVREETNAGLFHELVKDHSRHNIEAARVAGTFIPLLEFNTQLFISAVLMLGGWRVFHGQTEVADLYQFILMSNVFFEPIRFLGMQYNQALTAMAGAERVFRVLDAQPDWQDAPGVRELPALRGRVEFDHVTFGYRPDRPVLHDLCFRVEPGETIALVGHTGSGKSSIINLIAKFYLPGQGRLLIDGVEVRDLATDSLRRRIGIVLQQNFLFTGSVMDNIRVGRPQASDDEVLAAARRLGCLDLLEALPNGLQTVVGERGAGISIGQRQLICFTRAMLANPEILILDEATSAVDTITEARLQQALATLLQGRTSFVVAHRLSTIRHATQVLVLDEGRIIERGNHDQLVAAGHTYAKLYQQFVQSTSA